MGRIVVLMMALAVGCGTESGGLPDAPDGGTTSAAAVECYADNDCAMGVCEGLGCGDTLGTCRVGYGGCRRDAVPYCGCDGETFRASSTCPAARYEHVGPCTR